MSWATRTAEIVHLSLGQLSTKLPIYTVINSLIKAKVCFLYLLGIDHKYKCELFLRTFRFYSDKTAIGHRT